MDLGLVGDGTKRRFFAMALAALLLGAGPDLQARTLQELPGRLFVQASVSTAGPYGESWYLTLTPDGRLWVEVFFSADPQGSLVGNFSVGEERMVALREVVLASDFFSLPAEMSPEKAHLHMPQLRIEVELDDRIHKSALYSPDQVEGADKSRFLQVWNALIDVLPFEPTW